MQRARPLGSLILALTVFAPASTSAQGIGGLIKKKAAEAIKPAEKPVAKADQPANSGNCNVTDDAVERFLKGLDAERADRAAFKAQLGALKSRDVWAACKNQVPLSPEAQKVMEPMTNAPSNISAADMQKLIEKMNTDMENLVKAKCGPEPEDWNNSKRQNRLQESEKVGAKAAGMDEGCYRLLKERAIPFCSLSQQQQQQAMTSGIKVPGASKGLDYVYTAAESRALAPKCAAIMAALKAIDSIVILEKGGA